MTKRSVRKMSQRTHHLILTCSVFILVILSTTVESLLQKDTATSNQVSSFEGLIYPVAYKDEPQVSVATGHPAFMSPHASPIDIVSGEWNQGLSDFYSGLAPALKLNIDLEKVKSERRRIAEILREAAKE